MFSILNWYEAATSERKLAFGVLAISALVLVLLLGSTLV
jgi:hypothetical protein